MILYNFLLHFMDDTERLMAYRKMKKVLANPKIKRNTEINIHNTLQEYDYNESCIRQGRIDNCTIPNHCYKKWNEDILLCSDVPLSKLKLKDIFMKILPHVCDILFYIKNDVVYVREEQWDYWQHISRSFSPMVLKVICLWKNNYDKDKREDVIKKNFENTALPATEKFIEKNLADIHIHWNKGKEADRAVLDFIKEPSKFININRKTDTIKIFKEWFGDMVFEELYELALEGKDYIDSINQCNIKYPFKDDELLMRHAWMLVHIFDNFQNKAKKADFIEFYFYLLVLGELRKRLVVQINQYGIEQFNHTFKTPFRGPSYYKDGKQIKQILGNNLNNCNHIELRLSPSQLKSITEIREGINRHIHLGKKPVVSFLCSISKNNQLSGLSLEEQENDLKNVINDIHFNLNEIVGVDITGKDFEVSPIAFVDFINTLRNEYKINQFTYHAGEDFFHIISGMRIIYEVIQFLRFDKNCRIGHASAVGVDPIKWAWCVKGCVPMKQGEYLDDLIFMYHFIKERNIVCLFGKCKQVETRILDIAKKVYTGSILSVTLIIAAWLNGTSVKDNDEYSKIIKVDCFEILDSVELRILQKALLHYISDNGCAIEACPTSNISIGYDHDLKSYHLKTWLKWKYKNSCMVPDIIIGSDEVGTFPTNIANEYACIQNMLKADPDFDNVLSDKIIEELIECSQKRSFS